MDLATQCFSVRIDRASLSLPIYARARPNTSAPLLQDTGVAYSCAAWFCKNSAAVAAAYSTQSCILTTTSYAEKDYYSVINAYTPQTCTQSTDARCTSAALSTMFSPFPTVYAAYCTDKFLIIISSGHGRLGNASYNLDDIPYPPGGTQSDGTACRTRSGSVSDGVLTLRFPLNPVKLPSAAYSNNLNICTFATRAANANAAHRPPPLTPTPLSSTRGLDE